MYAVYNKETKEFMTCALGSSFEECLNFYNKLTNGMKKQCGIFSFGWSEVVIN